jgi:pimeloyl-ACP methyl ester carboxylesterase
MSDPVAEPPDLSERAAELATLIEHVGFVRPHLVGAVEGCATVVYLAATQPDKVGRIQLFAPWICGSGRHPWSISEEAYRQWLDAAANWGEGKSLDLLFPSMARSQIHRRPHEHGRFTALAVDKRTDPCDGQQPRSGHLTGGVPCRAARSSEPPAQ